MKEWSRKGVRNGGERENGKVRRGRRKGKGGRDGVMEEERVDNEPGRTESSGQ